MSRWREPGVGFGSRRSVRLLSCAASMLALALTFTWAMPEADAQKRSRKPEDAFRKQIILAASPFPADFESDKAFIAYLKKVRTNELWPNKEGGSWTFDYMVFFTEGLSRKQKYAVTFYDITDPNKTIFITENPNSPAASGLRVINGTYTLDPQFFKSNRKFLMTYAERGGAVLAEVEFVLRPYDADRAARIRAEREEAVRKAKEERENRVKKNKNPKLNSDPGGTEW